MEGKDLCNTSTEKRALEYCSNEKLLTEELNLLVNIFQQNGYPSNIIQIILFKERPSKEKTKLDFSRIFYVPYHPRIRRLCRVLEEKFAIQTVHSRVKMLGGYTQEQN